MNAPGLIDRSYSGTTPNQETNTVIVEFDIKGKPIERKKILKIEYHLWRQWFYDNYGLDGIMYVVLPSKMNFQSLIESNERDQ